MHPANKALRSQGTTPAADTTEVAARLAQLPLFSGADRNQLLAIAEAGYALSAPANWSLIWKKTPADKAYIILSGQVEVRLDDSAIVLGAGAVVGEKAIIEQKLRSATVVTRTPLEVLHFPADTVQRLYAEVPAFRNALDAALAAQRAA